MNADSDLMKLYSVRILELASSIPNIGRLENPTGSSKKRSPLCGSTVAADTIIANGAIEDFALDVKACALGQAAAAVVGANAIGATKDDLERVRKQLREMLKSGGPAPDAPFEELAVLEPAKDFENRHASILLTLDALIETFDAA